METPDFGGVHSETRSPSRARTLLVFEPSLKRGIVLAKQCHGFLRSTIANHTPFGPGRIPVSGLGFVQSVETRVGLHQIDLGLVQPSNKPSKA